jgi:hypothetical protein
MAKKKKKAKAEASQLDSFSAAPEALDVAAAQDQVGKTSGEMKTARPRSEGGLAFGLWDLTALLSLLCITAATVLLFLELQQFGNLLQGSWPWSVSTAKITAAAPPAIE